MTPVARTFGEPKTAVASLAPVPLSATRADLDDLMIGVHRPKGDDVPNSSRAFREASASAAATGGGGLRIIQARKMMPVASMITPAHSWRLMPADLLIVARLAPIPGMMRSTPKITNSVPINDRESNSLASHQFRASSGGAQNGSNDWPWVTIATVIGGAFFGEVAGVGPDVL